ncbi:MAG: DUF948 domain-containing protein [Eubacteriaceae bacterium]|nr:DUF948 domain-containing protein [Eubacteriaceae bacterium]MBR0384816.1 DUF948 domain-containing protein [Eubacteriaceae bacterium]
MISVSFQLWELAIFIVAVAVVFAVIYLVKFLKSLSKAADDVDALLQYNRANIDKIVDNTNDITDSTKNVMNDAETAVSRVSNELVDPVLDTTGKAIKVVSNVVKAASVVAK